MKLGGKRYLPRVRSARVFGSTAAAGAVLAGTLGASAAPAAHPTITDLAADPVQVAVASPANAWAAQQDSAQVLHWNGTKWALQSLPGVGSGVISAVTADSPSDAWAVGLNGATTKVLADHWNGTSWTSVAVAMPPEPNGIDMPVVSADSPSDVWIMGKYGIDGPPHQHVKNGTLALHWNGTSWELATAPNLDPQAVTVISATDAWAVGLTNPPHAATIIADAMHWNGTAWTRVSLPNPGPYGDELSSISGDSPSDVWAVGYDTSTPTVGVNLVLHWNGTRWSRVTVPNPGANPSLDGVHVVSPTLAWAAGTSMKTPGVLGANTELLQWNGKAWTQVPGKFYVGPYGTLSGVAASSADNAWAVGYYESGSAKPVEKTLMLHWNGSTWTRS